uniref:PABS domain-containing protein n=1 Tax=viral metagenome TaxID=1070528 RepID=A0A6C0K1K2_9ZZZZ
MDYQEHDPILQVTYTWHNCRLVYRETTHQGTLVELVERPIWGLTCYMDGVIQSCELDEELYHQTFVKAVLKGGERVCLFGGGEGALAREVLSYSDVQQVDMYEWDKDVVRIFQEHGASWSKGAWSHPKLRLFHEDAFQIRTDQHRLQYDAVLIDLFDLDESALKTWIPFLQNAAAWCRKQIGLYVMTQAPFPVATPLLEHLSDVLRAAGFLIHPLTVYIPSFHGYATFLVGERFPAI